VGVVNVIATYAVLLLMDRCGRRTLILVSSGGMFISCIIIVLSLNGYFDHIIALVAVNGFVSFFEVRIVMYIVIIISNQMLGFCCKQVCGIISSTLPFTHQCFVFSVGQTFSLIIVWFRTHPVVDCCRNV
jgi:MFS transporter, SP family, solute carrier family 2 (facilitated glucose transporter), member 3